MCHEVQSTVYLKTNKAAEGLIAPGAGRIATSDIPANVVAEGNLCKVIREINGQDNIYYIKIAHSSNRAQARYQERPGLRRSHGKDLNPITCRARIRAPV